MADSHYTILQLSRTASDVDIKKQFRKLAVQYHPDKNPGNADAELMMKKINAAYSVLGDSIARKKYDQELEYANRPAQQPNWNQNPQKSHHQSGQNTHHGYHFETFNEFLQRINSFFHDYTTSFGDVLNVAMQNYSIVVTVTPEEALKGCIKPFEFVKTENCKQCKGRTFAPGTCKICLNGAVTIKSKNKTLILPAGLTHNSVWKSENELFSSPGGQQFDLYIRVQIVDPNAKSEHDVEMRATIPLETAYKGADIKITTSRGSIKIKVPELTYTGKQVRIPNRGNIDEYTGFMGDLYLTFTVEIPSNPTQTQQMQIEKIIEKQRTHEKHNN